MPEHHRAVGVVEAATRTDLAIQTDGFVTQVLVKAGDHVEKGQVILITDSPELHALHAGKNAKLKELRSEQRKALSEDQVILKSKRAQIEVVNEALTKIQERLDDLVLRSPMSGTLVSDTIMSQLIGQHLPKGEVIGKIVDLDTLRVTALMDQAQNAKLFDQANAISRVELRTAGQLDRTLRSKLIQVFPSGRFQLPHPALGHAGGGAIAISPDDPKGQTATRPQFELWLKLPDWRGGTNNYITAFPGQRVYVRLTSEKYSPLRYQWIHKLRQLFRERLSI